MATKKKTSAKKAEKKAEKDDPTPKPTAGKVNPENVVQARCLASGAFGLNLGEVGGFTEARLVKELARPAPRLKCRQVEDQLRLLPPHKAEKLRAELAAAEASDKAAKTPDKAKKAALAEEAKVRKAERNRMAAPAENTREG